MACRTIMFDFKNDTLFSFFISSRVKTETLATQRIGMLMKSDPIERTKTVLERSFKIIGQISYLDISLLFLFFYLLYKIFVFSRNLFKPEIANTACLFRNIMSTRGEKKNTVRDAFIYADVFFPRIFTTATYLMFLRFYGMVYDLVIKITPRRNNSGK